MYGFTIRELILFAHLICKIIMNYGSDHVFLPLLHLNSTSIRFVFPSKPLTSYRPNSVRGNLISNKRLLIIQITRLTHARLLILRRIGRDVLQCACNGLWHGWRCRQMCALRHVSVDIVSCVSNCVDNSIVSGVAVRSLGDNHIAGVRTGSLLQRTSLFAFDSIASLVAEKGRMKRF